MELTWNRIVYTNWKTYCKDDFFLISYCFEKYTHEGFKAYYIFFIYIFKYIFITHLSLCLWYLENCNVRLVTKMARDKKWDHFLWNSKIYSGSGWRYQFFFTSFNLLLKYEIAFCFFLTCNFHNIWIIILQHVQANSVLSMVMILKYIREFLKNFKQQLCGSVTRLSHLVYGSGLL